MQYTNIYQSPTGEILLACNEVGLTGLWFKGGKYYALGLDKEHEARGCEAVVGHLLFRA